MSFFQKKSLACIKAFFSIPMRFCEVIGLTLRKDDSCDSTLAIILYFSIY